MRRPASFFTLSAPLMLLLCTVALGAVDDMMGDMAMPSTKADEDTMAMGGMAMPPTTAEKDAMPPMEAGQDAMPPKNAQEDAMASMNMNADSDIPPMKAYLHWSWSEVILTLNWIPRSDGQMVGAWFAFFFAAIFAQAYRTWWNLLEAKWARELQAGGISINPAGWQQRVFKRQLINKEQFYRNCIRSVFTFTTAVIDYLFMLTVMSFNIGLILFICLGFAVGALLFGHAEEMSGHLVAANTGPTGMPPDNLGCHFANNEGKGV